jgi:septin family protein
MIIPPVSRMDILTTEELNSFLSISPLVSRYNIDINSESANEILEKRINEKMAIIQEEQMKKIEENKP